jgi:asparagine synthase (glutamine-hydrolysing)
LNTYAISKVIREAGLVVALSGVGGDELFGGYDGYRKAILAERWADRTSLFPAAARSLASGLVGRFARRENWRKLSDLLRDPQGHYFLTRQVFSAAQISELLEAEAFRPGANWSRAAHERLSAETADYDSVNRASALEVQTYMLSTLLRDTDQMSMAHALEVRVPLLDHKLVEYLFTLPGAIKLDEDQPKPLLTKALNGDLPRECVHRPKRGFELPFPVWLRQSLLTQVRSKLLNPAEGPREIFRLEGLKGVWEHFERGRLAWSRVWGLFILFEWLEEHRVKA